MLDEQDIFRAVYGAIDEVNLQLPQERRLGKSRATCIAGDSGRLDSLQLISLIVSIEENLEQICHVTLNMSDKEDMFSAKNSPLATVETLVCHISSLCGVEPNV